MSVAMNPLTLIALEGSFAVCRLPAGSEPPGLADALPFSSITRSGDEVSIVCPLERAPSFGQAEAPWRCLRIAGVLDFAMVGVLASVLSPLADAGVPVFVTSTFDTDYLMIKEIHFEKAVEVLRRAGHRVHA